MSTMPTTTILDSDDLDAAVTHYLLSALWSSIDEDGNPLDNDHDLTDVADEMVAKAREDVVSFLELVGHEDVTAYRGLARFAPYGDDEVAGQLGHDLWLTRNHHGAGFWDRGLGDLGDRLTKWAHSMGEVDLYVGDDGLIYGE